MNSNQLKPKPCRCRTKLACVHALYAYTSPQTMAKLSRSCGSCCDLPYDHSSSPQGVPPGEPKACVGVQRWLWMLAYKVARWDMASTLLHLLRGATISTPPCCYGTART